MRETDREVNERVLKELKLVSEDHAMRKEEYVDSRRRWEAEIERLRQLVEESFREGFCEGVIAGHPMHSRSSYSEAWENSNSKSEAELL